MFDKQSLEPSALTAKGTVPGAEPAAGGGALGTTLSKGSTYHHYHQPHR